LRRKKHGSGSTRTKSPYKFRCWGKYCSTHHHQLGADSALKLMM
jgi:hypothetical protein